MRCKCGYEVDTPFCPMCGRQMNRPPSRRTRGNGQGTVVKRGNKYRAVVTLGYYTTDDGKRHRKTRSQTFDRKKDAVAALTALKGENRQTDITLKDCYDRWEPTHKAGLSTMTNYKAAFKYFGNLWFEKMRYLQLDDLQECLDECGHGRRTQENMRAVLGLLYKYAIPRDYAEKNMAQYLKITAEAGSHRQGFTLDEVEKIRKNVNVVPGAREILCMIYTGFRPGEFLALKGKDFDPVNMTLTGGSKTEAGRNRIVTISPKIIDLIPHKPTDAPLWDVPTDLSNFTDRVFHPCLDACGISNPIENGRHKYTPHSCRHTFATLMKAVPGADKDKMELIGHASSEMLRYYQDVGIEDLRKITDKI